MSTRQAARSMSQQGLRLWAPSSPRHRSRGPPRRPPRPPRQVGQAQALNTTAIVALDAARESLHDPRRARVCRTGFVRSRRSGVHGPAHALNIGVVLCVVLPSHLRPGVPRGALVQQIPALSRTASRQSGGLPDGTCPRELPAAGRVLHSSSAAVRLIPASRRVVGVAGPLRVSRARTRSEASRRLRSV